MVVRRSLTTVRRMIFYRGDLDFVFFARFVDGTTGGWGQLHTPQTKRKIIIRVILKEDRKKKHTKRNRKKKKEKRKRRLKGNKTNVFKDGVSQELVNRLSLGKAEKKKKKKKREQGKEKSCRSISTWFAADFPPPRKCILLSSSNNNNRVI